jgi:hypothetical protein
VGNLYYTTIGRTKCHCSLQSSFVHCPCLVPPTPLTYNRLPPGASLPGSQSERNPQPYLDGWTPPQWRRIMLRTSTTDTGSPAEVTMAWPCTGLRVPHSGYLRASTTCRHGACIRLPREDATPPGVRARRGALRRA